MKNLMYNILGGSRLPAGQAGKSEDRSRKTEDACLPARQGSRENYSAWLAGNGFIRPAGLEALPAEQKSQTSKGFTRPVGLGGLPVERFLQTSRGFGRPVGVMTLPVGEFLQPSREFTRPVGQGSGKTEDESRLPAGQAGKLEAGSRKSEARSTKREAGFSSLLNHCSNFLAPLSTLAKGDEIRFSGSEGVVTPSNVGKENKEYRPRESLRTITNLEDRRPKTEVGSLKREARSRNLTSNDKPTKFQNSAPSPLRQLADGWGEAPHKTLSCLPQESGFVSGECPGAAAITILPSLFSSPRVSPIFAGFTQTNLPVINCPETGGFLWYCHPDGRYSGQGTSTHPERPLQRTKPERRYAYVLN